MIYTGEKPLMKGVTLHKVSCSDIQAAPYREPVSVSEQEGV